MPVKQRKTTEERKAETLRKKIIEAEAFYGYVVGEGRFVLGREVREHFSWTTSHLDQVKKTYRQHLAEHKKRVMVVCPAMGPKAKYGVFATLAQAEEYMRGHNDRVEILVTNHHNYVVPTYKQQFGITPEVQRAERIATGLGIQVFADEVTA